MKSEFNIAETKDVKSLWPSDAICRHLSESALALVIASCPMASNHYMIKCWLIGNGIVGLSAQSNLTHNKKLMNFTHYMCLDMTLFKLLPHLPRANGLKGCELPTQDNLKTKKKEIWKLSSEPWIRCKKSPHLTFPNYMGIRNDVIFT